MYFADLTPYRYSPSPDAATHEPEDALNVGWLGRENAFQTTKSPSRLVLDALFVACTQPVNRTRGWHKCEFCDLNPPVVVERGSEKLHLGGAEIRVVGRSGQRYASPDLIYHYVDAHRYAPPQDFVDGLSDQSPRAR